MNDDLSFFAAIFCSHNHPPELYYNIIIVTKLASTAEFQEECVFWRALNVEKGLNFKIKFFVHTCKVKLCV